ncbi:MAG: transposase [Candidatus Latescibacteria bacterium]|nr:transposase [Candidatus Latescibacterota bacterium]
MHKSFKYRLRPTKKQEKILLTHIQECRLLYNQLVCARVQGWKNDQTSLSLYEQQRTLKLMKQQHPEFAQVYSQVLQQVAVRVDLAFKAFFRRVKECHGKAGFPRYKGQNRYDSITYPQFSNGCRLDEKGLRLGKIGCIRIVQHRLLEGVPKTCTVTRTATGKWFATISCDMGDATPKNIPHAHAEGMAKPHHNVSNTDVGLDVGLEKFATLSTGEEIPNPRFFRKEEKALARAQRKWDKVKKDSHKKREKARKVVARVHERIRNKRHNFAHQESRKLVNCFLMIAIEDLPVNRMVHNRCLSKSISDAAWSMFRQCITYKAEEAGGVVEPVDPAYTSQDCSQCGHRLKKTLSDRRHKCPCCGVDMDRDLNAAINILRLGRQSQVAKLPRSPSGV